MNVTQIRRARDQRRPRVAAYCRVSTMLEQQEGSMRTQIDHYRELIEMNAGLFQYNGDYYYKAGSKVSFLYQSQPTVVFVDAVLGFCDNMATMETFFGTEDIGSSYFADFLLFRNRRSEAFS